MFYIRSARYFVHELHECQHFIRTLVSKSAVCLKRKLRLLVEKPRMSGFHLGIRFEVSAKLAGTRGSEAPNFETSRVTYRRLPSNLSTCCRKFMKKILNNSLR